LGEGVFDVAWAEVVGWVIWLALWQRVRWVDELFYRNLNFCPNISIDV
jgi:hypothetical protein